MCVPDPIEASRHWAWATVISGVLPSTTRHFSARTEAAGFRRMTWRWTSTSKTPGLVDGNGRRRVATGATIEAVVLQLAGKVRKKVCVRCEENKPLDEFCRRSDLPDGREYRCKVCERLRVKNYALRKAAVG